MATVQLFSGGLTRIDEQGQWTGIYKQAVAGPVAVSFVGLAGDVQADRRVHGGPEKAVHHYAVENYERLAKIFPALAARLVAGSIGENISASGFDESSVCIGDVFRLGSATLQVSQPRSPCWKIDHRYGSDGVARAIAETGLTGWYYRVLEEGTVSNGDELALLESLPGAVSLAHLWGVWREHRPEPVILERMSAAPGLTTGWRKKLIDRLLWLREHTDKSAPAPTSQRGRQD